MNELNKPPSRLATTIKLDEAHIAAVDDFLARYRKKHPALEITFSQAARYLILQGEAFDRYERAETERILSEMERMQAALERLRGERNSDEERA